VLGKSALSNFMLSTKTNLLTYAAVDRYLRRRPHGAHGICIVVGMSVFGKRDAETGASFNQGANAPLFLAIE